MQQSATIAPDHTVQRKAAIARGAALEHTGKVLIAPIPNFDLNRTIFKTLEGKLPRFLMKTRIGKHALWDAAATNTAQHYPNHSPLVMLLHSILGTGTNTFAMNADKIPPLRPLMTDWEWTQVQAFPSVLRLLYVGSLGQELRSNAHRADAISSITFHRVIDNAPIAMDGKDFWIALNYQLIHLIDFLPAANWSVHQNDISFILFRDLYDLLSLVGKREASVGYTPSAGPRKAEGEPQGVGEWLTTLMPVSLNKRLAARSVTRFSERIGHSLDYKITWA